MDFAQDDGSHQMLLPKFVATEAIGEQPTAKSRRAEQGRCRVNRLSGLVFDGVWLRWHGIGLHRLVALVGGALNFGVFAGSIMRIYVSNGGSPPSEMYSPKLLIKAHACHFDQPSASSVGGEYAQSGVRGSDAISAWCAFRCRSRPRGVSLTIT